MNPLGELLHDVARVSLEDVHQATAAALRELRHDSRVRRLAAQADLDDALAGLPAPTDVRLLRPWLVEPLRTEHRWVYGAGPLFWFEVRGDVPDEETDVLSAIRVADAPLGVQVWDRRRALLLLDDSEPWWVEEPTLLAALLELHRRTWLLAQRTGPEPCDVLNQLLSGRTDEAAAHHLHLSLRTYRRRVQELLTALGASSRFAAGARAQALGLLDLLPETRPQVAS